LSAIDDRHPEWKLSQSLHQFHFAHDGLHLEHFFHQVIQEAVTPSLLQACGLRLALDTLLLEVVRGITDPEITLSPLSVHPAVSKALEILETRFKKNWTLSELAQEVGLSRSRLAELFNLETGYSIRKFLTRIRLQYAETLLNHSDLPIGDIAAECGFATIQHFSRVFKQTHWPGADQFSPPLRRQKFREPGRFRSVTRLPPLIRWGARSRPRRRPRPRIRPRGVTE
jgi:AraC-like DNA-binding protein